MNIILWEKGSSICLLHIQKIQVNILIQDASNYLKNFTSVFIYICY